MVIALSNRSLSDSKARVVSTSVYACEYCAQGGGVHAVRKLVHSQGVSIYVRIARVLSQWQWHSEWCCTNRELVRQMCSPNDAGWIDVYDDRFRLTTREVWSDL